MEIGRFLIASAILTLMPGPDIVFVLVQGVTRGWKAAQTVSLGLCSGLFFHTAAAALGLSLIVARSPFLFAAVRYAGVAYLLYMGTVSFLRRNRSGKAERSEVSPEPVAEKPGRLYRTGILMNLLNPKVILFFLAFLPQFFRTEADATPRNIFVLGVLFAAQALLIFSAVSLLGGLSGNRISLGSTPARTVAWINALVYWGIALLFLFA